MVHGTLYYTMSRVGQTVTAERQESIVPQLEPFSAQPHLLRDRLTATAHTTNFHATARNCHPTRRPVSPVDIVKIGHSCLLNTFNRRQHVHGLQEDWCPGRFALSSFHSPLAAKAMNRAAHVPRTLPLRKLRQAVASTAAPAHARRQARSRARAHGNKANFGGRTARVSTPRLAGISSASSSCPVARLVRISGSDNTSSRVEPRSPIQGCHGMR